MTTEAGEHQADSTGQLREWMLRSYFACAAGARLVLSVWGFSDNLLWDLDQPTNSDPKFVVHGLLCLLWMLMLFVQATLVRVRRVSLHRGFGVAGAFVAVGVVVSTAYVFWEVRRPWGEMPLLVQANRGLLLGFAALVVLGFWNRGRPAWHKRYLLLASLFMLEPVLSRSFDPIEPLLQRFTDAQIDAAWWWFFILMWGALWSSLVVYDRTVSDAVHPATRNGIVLFLAVWVAVLLV